MESTRDESNGNAPISRQEVSAVNREAWNEAAPIHADIHFDRLLAGFKTPGFSCIQGIKQDAVLAHGVEGKAVVQPCCNNGRDLLSIKNLGASRCVGFDISDEFIEQGKRLAAAGGIECELVQADVYEIPADYNEQFDVAYVTAGSLRPLPDVDAFFAAVARLMRCGAWMFVQEMHPIIDMYSMQPSKKPRWIRHSYFHQDPFRLTDGLDYYRVRSYRAKPRYSFHHKLSDIIQACVSNGLRIETFQERDNDCSGGTFERLQRGRKRLPLSYTLTAIRD